MRRLRLTGWLLLALSTSVSGGPLGSVLVVSSNAHCQELIAVVNTVYSAGAEAVTIAAGGVPSTAHACLVSADLPARTTWLDRVPQSADEYSAVLLVGNGWYEDTYLAQMRGSPQPAYVHDAFALIRSAVNNGVGAIGAVGPGAYALALSSALPFGTQIACYGCPDLIDACAGSGLKPIIGPTAPGTPASTWPAGSAVVTSEAGNVAIVTTPIPSTWYGPEDGAALVSHYGSLITQFIQEVTASVSPTPGPATPGGLEPPDTSSWSKGRLVLQNPSLSNVEIAVWYATPGGLQEGPQIELSTVEQTALPLSAGSVDPYTGSVVVTADGPIVVQRRLDPLPGSTDCIASAFTQSFSNGAPSAYWYLPESRTRGAFDTWLTIRNPGDTSVTAEITYMTPDGSRSGPRLTVDAKGMEKVYVDASLPDLETFSAHVSATGPILAERAMYWPGQQTPQASMGVSSPATTWYLPMGRTDGDFDTYILVQNPGTESAHVDIVYAADAGTVTGESLAIAPMSRASVRVSDSMPNAPQFSSTVTSTTPIVAERAMYWQAQPLATSFGVSAPATTWYLPEGRTDPGFDTLVSVANPGDEPAHVNVAFHTPAGSTTGPIIDVLPRHSAQFDVSDWLPSMPNISATVTSDVPIVAERALYWHCSSVLQFTAETGISRSSQMWYLPDIGPARPQGNTPGTNADSPADRDGDGVPDEDDFCPDFPGSPATNGC